MVQSRVESKSGSPSKHSLLVLVLYSRSRVEQALARASTRTMRKVRRKLLSAIDDSRFGLPVLVVTTRGTMLRPVLNSTGWKDLQYNIFFEGISKRRDSKIADVHLYLLQVNFVEREREGVTNNKTVQGTTQYR